MILTVPTPNVTLILSQGPHHVGTSVTLTCSVTLPQSIVDTNVRVNFRWTPYTNDDRMLVTEPITLQSPFISTLTINPLGMDDTSQYSCEASAYSDSQYITSSSGSSQEVLLLATGKGDKEQNPQNFIVIGSFRKNIFYFDGENDFHSARIIILCFSSALPPPVVNFTFIGESVRGQTLELWCSATFNGLTDLSTTEMRIDTANSILVSVVNASSVKHEFVSLGFTDSGQYTCVVIVNLPQVNINALRSSKTKTLTVTTGKPLDISYLEIITHLLLLYKHRDISSEEFQW